MCRIQWRSRIFLAEGVSCVKEGSVAHSENSPEDQRRRAGGGRELGEEQQGWSWPGGHPGVRCQGAQGSCSSSSPQRLMEAVTSFKLGETWPEFRLDQTTCLWGKAALGQGQTACREQGAQGPLSEEKGRMAAVGLQLERTEMVGFRNV